MGGARRGGRCASWLAERGADGGEESPSWRAEGRGGGPWGEWDEGRAPYLENQALERAELRGESRDDALALGKTWEKMGWPSVEPSMDKEKP